MTYRLFSPQTGGRGSTVTLTQLGDCLAVLVDADSGAIIEAFPDHLYILERDGARLVVEWIGHERFGDEEARVRIFFRPISNIAKAG
jgi:hypothetical protein